MTLAARTLAFAALLLLSASSPGSSAPLSQQRADHVGDDAAIEWSVDPTDECCKICKKGKACGNSCISRDKSCHQPPGCACDG